MTFPTPEEIAREAREALSRGPQMSPRELFVWLVRQGFINGQGQVTKRIGGSADLEPNYETWTLEDPPRPEDAGS